MNTKLTLRLDERLVAKAKREARRRGKSVSRMVAEYFGALGEEAIPRATLPPVTRSLFGLLKGKPLSEEDYLKHLKEKHL